MNDVKVLFILLISALLIPRFSFSQDDDTKNLTNLVVFVRFADDEEITHSFAQIDTMFNGKTEGFLSVRNFYKSMTYGKINYNTIYTNNIQNGNIISYQDIYPRGYFEPYSPMNPIGYQEEIPFMGVSMREAQLLGRIVHYVDSMNLVDTDVILDGDGDGDIDNISFIVKGGTGEWASILWPHMEYFPHDSLDYEVTINGVRPNTFNFEFEGSFFYFSAHVFRHEMGHSLDLPDLYHYINYQNVSPAGTWDMMCSNYGSNHTAAIYKNKILKVSDDPIQITEDGDYTLYSVGSSSSQNCYYIKSAIDTTQWYVFEYRNQDDLFEDGIPETGLIVARWNDTVPLDYHGMFANSFFDYHTQAHQYWIFRPGSNSDTINGFVDMANFSAASGRTAFGPTTNPYPYLTDGTPENSFEITDIQENGNTLTFHVHFFNSGLETYDNFNNLKVYPNPTADVLNIEFPENEISNVSLLDVQGRIVISEISEAKGIVTLQVKNVPTGIYILQVADKNGRQYYQKVVKK